jgi:hypothetical protein
MIRQIQTLLIVGMLLPGLPSVAHHAPAIYDLENERTLTGTVVTFEWVQPHTWARVTTIDTAGKETMWSLEGMSPDYLGRRGWNRSSLRPGDVIEVDYFPRRDGTPIGMFIRARLPDGSLKVMAISPPLDERKAPEAPTRPAG